MTEQTMDLSKYDGDGYDNVVVTINQSKKIGRQSYFPSNKENSFIVNAETGEAYPWRVGSRDSCRLFKMVDSTGTCDSNGFKMNHNDDAYPNRNPNHIYYDSPEQYMKHQRTTLAPHFQTNFNKRKETFVNTDS
jgi:hypothetical protein